MKIVGRVFGCGGRVLRGEGQRFWESALGRVKLVPCKVLNALEQIRFLTLVVSIKRLAWVREKILVFDRVGLGRAWVNRERFAPLNQYFRALQLPL